MNHFSDKCKLGLTAWEEWGRKPLVIKNKTWNVREQTSPKNDPPFPPKWLTEGDWADLEFRPEKWEGRSGYGIVLSRWKAEWLDPDLKKMVHPDRKQIKSRRTKSRSETNKQIKFCQFLQFATSKNLLISSSCPQE